jgi:hypothetical protein
VLFKARFADSLMSLTFNCYLWIFCFILLLVALGLGRIVTFLYLPVIKTDPRSGRTDNHPEIVHIIFHHYRPLSHLKSASLLGCHTAPVYESILESAMSIIQCNGLLTRDEWLFVHILINVFQRLEIVGVRNEIFEFYILWDVSTNLGRGITEPL